MRDRHGTILNQSQIKAAQDAIGGGMPSTLVVVDQDGELIGRMQVEASGVVTAHAARARVHALQGAWR